MTGDYAGESYREQQLRKAYDKSVSRVMRSANVRENFFRNLCESTFEAASDVFDQLEADLRMSGADLEDAFRRARTALYEVRGELEETLRDV